MLLLTLLLLASSCSNPEVSPTPERVLIANKISRKCAQKLSKKYGLYPCGGGGRMMFEVEGLCLAFTLYRSLSKEEARDMLIDCTHEVISAVNTNKEVQKYLVPGGFTDKHVEIQIFVYPNHKRSSHPEIAYCSNHFGRLLYDTNDPDPERGCLTTEKETYQEAIALLEKAKNHL